jgi:hypothetical protein
MRFNHLIPTGIIQLDRSRSIAGFGLRTPMWLGKAMHTGALGCFCLVLAACDQEKPEHPPKNYALLATDMHVSVARHHMVLPFIALGDYRRRQSFSLNRARDKANDTDALGKIVSDSSDSEKPKSFERLSVEFGPYGWDDNDMQQRQICSMLTQKWAQAACDNPWSVVLQSLPQRIELVDLGRLRVDSPEPRIPRCAKNSLLRRALPASDGEAKMICELEISGGKPATYYVAVVRIEGELGAAWSVGRGSQSGESVEAMTVREGESIVAFVQYGLGPHEDFARLYDILCKLRKPGSRPGVDHLDCGDTHRR